MNRVLFCLAVLTSIAFAHFADAQNLLTIENRFLTVRCDGSGDTFSVTDKASGRVFLKDGHLHGHSTNPAGNNQRGN